MKLQKSFFKDVAVAQVSNQTVSRVWNQVSWNQVRVQVIRQVRNQVYDQVWEQINIQVWGQFKNQIIKSRETAKK